MKSSQTQPSRPLGKMLYNFTFEHWGYVYNIWNIRNTEKLVVSEYSDLEIKFTEF